MLLKLILICAVWLVAVNALVFAAFGYDKQRARQNARRISENNLLLLVLLGGSVGAIFGQQHFRHKTKKQPFKTKMWLIIVLQIIVLLTLATPIGRDLIQHLFR